MDWNELTDFGPPIPGKVHGPEVANQQDHFHSCPEYCQPVDQRYFRQTFWHEVSGHEPLEPEAQAKVIEFRHPNNRDELMVFEFRRTVLAIRSRL
ncbi:hypothetical protein [Mesorhizobium sp. BH1-1-4]|uniref:hypothetical protein n=1 Tax=Mesorhizobium sp. BH1-1-4 TaxID=2876662 RepID=UPI001CD0CFBF|nr:hypothetical protein [Mesorhizobium sp. BH1-1-4]MBZ9993123.1 hypothetical protein [Mesorhizobium sp. BH1-1-4]